MKKKLIIAKGTMGVSKILIGKDFEKAVKKMEKILELELISSGLLIRVQGMKDPILDEELSRCKDFGRKVATPSNSP